MPELSIRQQKQALRKRMRALRDAITPTQRAAWSARIFARVLASPAYKQARVIHCYLPIRSEVDPRPIVEQAFAQGKRVAIPLWQAHTDETLACEIDTLSEDAFEVDAMGLRIPRRRVLLPPGEIDLVLVPLLAFARALAPAPGAPGEELSRSPSPGTPGEGRVRATGAHREPWNGDAAPHLTSPGVPGEELDSLAPSPGTPGEGGGEGRSCGCNERCADAAPHLTSPGVPGEELSRSPSSGVPGEELGRSPSPGTPGEGRGEGEGYVRLGYGAGFYDRFLRRTQARRVGLAFALQQVDTLPQAETDTLLDDVITE